MKNLAAVALGKLGGLKGGKARAAKLTPEQRREIAMKGARARWAGRARATDGWLEPERCPDPRAARHIAKIQVARRTVRPEQCDEGTGSSKADRADPHARLVAERLLHVAAGVNSPL